MIGGGHAHAIVLEQFARNPLPSHVEVVLVSRDAQTPYSGMLPGFVAGHYEHDDLHIDLPQLSARAGARFVHGNVVALSPSARSATLADGTTLEADVIALDIGSAPDLSAAGPEADITPVKPISAFVERWRALESRVSGGVSTTLVGNEREPGQTGSQGRLGTAPQNEPSGAIRDTHQPAHQGLNAPRVAVVGGGAGGTEMLLAIQHRLTEAGCTPSMSLVTGPSGVLPSFPSGVRERFRHVLEQRRVQVMKTRVTSVAGRTATFSDGTQARFDELLWVTRASPQGWLAASGLATDEQGFMLVSATLESVSHPGIFGSGDCASMEAHPREKAGVYAVRQGLPLARNLRSALMNKPGTPFVPQPVALSLISTGDRYAIATRGGRLHAAGGWVWRWKDHIDRSFMKRFV